MRNGFDNLTWMASLSSHSRGRRTRKTWMRGMFIMLLSVMVVAALQLS